MAKATQHCYQTTSIKKNKEDSTMVENHAKWEELHDTILDLILLRLSVHDCIRFAAVCTSWRQAQRNHHVRHPCPEYPLLVYNDSVSTDIYTVMDRSCISREIVFQGTFGSYIVASAYGWLLCFDILGPEQFFLVNPITSSRINFPNKRMQSTEYYHCAIISSDPCTTEPKDLFIMLVVDNALIFCRATDSEWSVIHTGEPYTGLVSDMVECNRKTYVVKTNGRFGRVDVSGNGRSTVEWLIHEDHCERLVERYSIMLCRFLVESLGDVLMVVAYPDSSVEVYKADLSRKTWTAVEDLGNQVLYVGWNCSLSAPVAAEGGGKSGIHITHPGEYLDLESDPKGVSSHRAMKARGRLRDLGGPTYYHWFVPSF